MSSPAQPTVAAPPNNGALASFDINWDVLLKLVELKRCTPFLGPETCSGLVPLASQVAEDWAESYRYPFEDTSCLPRVAQFAKTHMDDYIVRADFVDQFSGCKPPGYGERGFADVDEPHWVLSGLPIPIYMVTHCHDFMNQALKARHKEPRRAWCSWRRLHVEEQAHEFDATIRPNVANPLVYHLFGHIDEPESLVIAEDDYLDFLVRTTEEKEAIPDLIQSAFRNHLLLFLGYELAELDFRVLLRKLVCQCQMHWKNQRRKHISIQTIHMVAVGDSTHQEHLEQAKDYLSKYCDSIEIGVTWGSSRDFAAELRRRWEGHHDVEAAKIR